MFRKVKMPKSFIFLKQFKIKYLLQLKHIKFGICKKVKQSLSYGWMGIKPVLRIALSNQKN